MVKNIILCLLFTLLTNCDLKPSQNSQFKWAVVDKSKIEKTVFDVFKKDSPYPLDIIGEEESSQQLNLAYNKLNKIKDERRRNCQTTVTEKDKHSKPKVHERDPVAENEMYMMGANGLLQPIRNAAGGEGEFVWRKDYNNCLRKIEVDFKTDPQVVALENEVTKLKDSELLRHKFDGETRKKLKEIVDKTVAEYAQKNNYQLIIPASPDVILYSNPKTTVNVTDAIAGLLIKSQLNSKTP